MGYIVHLKSASLAYKSWTGIHQRCGNPRHKSWKNYGGRGITVCEHWGTFAAFYADMGDRQKGQSIDRIDYNGNYEPSNCRWATATEQQNNRRGNRIYTAFGETTGLHALARKWGINRVVVEYRLKLGMSIEDALSRPAIRGRSFSPRPLIKTHCPHGHAYAQHGRIHKRDGKPRCAKCHLIKSRRKAGWPEHRLDAVSQRASST